MVLLCIFCGTNLSLCFVYFLTGWQCQCQCQCQRQGRPGTFLFSFSPLFYGTTCELLRPRTTLTYVPYPTGKARSEIAVAVAACDLHSVAIRWSVSRRALCKPYTHRFAVFYMSRAVLFLRKFLVRTISSIIRRTMSKFNWSTDFQMSTVPKQLRSVKEVEARCPKLTQPTK